MIERKERKKKSLFTYKKELLKREFTLEGIMENITILICVIPLGILMWTINTIILCLSM